MTLYPSLSRLSSAIVRDPLVVLFPSLELLAPAADLGIHPRWQTVQPGPLPPFVRARGSPTRPSTSRKTRTVRTITTEILIADAALRRLRILADRRAARAAPAATTVVHGTIRYHALPYGYQLSTLFDISVPREERVIALDAFAPETTRDLPPHLCTQRSFTRRTQFTYTVASGQIVRIIDPYQHQPICHCDSLDYLCDIALKDSTSPTFHDFALARYSQRHFAGRPELYITNWTPRRHKVPHRPSSPRLQHMLQRLTWQIPSSS